MIYQDFKTYIQQKHGDILEKTVTDFVNENHDGQGFHSINVLSLCAQKVEGISIKSIKCEDQPGPFVKININLTADIVMLGLGTKKYEADRKTRWFTVHTKAKLTNQLEFSEEETWTQEYASETFDKATALDEFLVPYIHTADLEDIADDFFAFYCKDAIYFEGYQFPFADVLREMGIEVYEADLPETTMGRMYFQKDKATVYWKFHPYMDEERLEDQEIEPGTMLISKNNFYLQRSGSTILTIAHEVIHWYYHQKFFRILSLLNEDQTMLNCSAEPQKYDENMTNLQKAMWFVEWQANSLGFRIAMPRGLFYEAMNEAYEAASKIPRKGAYDAEVMEDTVSRVAKLFGVSKYAAKQRAIQLGFDIASGTHIYINNHYHDPFSFEPGTLGQKQTFVIDREGLEKVCKENQHIKQLLDSGKFIYLDYVVCINDKRYIKKKNLRYHRLGECEYELKDFYRDHVDECCLIFDWESISGSRDDGGFYGQSYLSKDISAENRIEHSYDPDFENNQTIEQMAAVIAELDKIDEDEEKILNETPDDFGEALIYHMDRRGITVDDLAYRSGLSTTTIKNYRSGKIIPDIDNLMAIFIGLNLKSPYCYDLLDIAGLSIKGRGKKQKAYRRLVNGYTDGNLEQWNMFLQASELDTIPNLRNQKKLER